MLFGFLIAEHRNSIRGLDDQKRRNDQVAQVKTVRVHFGVGLVEL
jgi:hypothetical protein